MNSTILNLSANTEISIGTELLQQELNNNSISESNW